MRFHWFLPTGGDARRLSASVHGAGIGGFSAASSAADGTRPAGLGYLTQLAQAADSLGYDGVLTPTGAHCEDAWVVTAALIAATRRLRFLVAFRPGLVSPVLAAQMAATFQRLSQGRLLLNVVTGGSDAEQRGYGDLLDHDQRYERAGEFLDVVRSAWSGLPFDYLGGYHEIRGGHLRRPPDPLPRIYFGGSSDPALEVAAKHADTYLTWGEPVAQVAEKVERVRERAERLGRGIRFGLRVHVLSRDTSEEAWRAADAMIAGLDDATIAAGQQRLRTLESEGQRRMLALHGGDRSRLLVAPNLWAASASCAAARGPHWSAATRRWPSGFRSTGTRGSRSSCCPGIRTLRRLIRSRSAYGRCCEARLENHATVWANGLGARHRLTRFTDVRPALATGILAGRGEPRTVPAESPPPPEPL